MSGLTVLVIGAGARQHALCWRLAGEAGVGRVMVAPGNPLIGGGVEVRPDVDGDDVDAIVALAVAESVDLVVIGPEGPLVAGIADKLAAAGIACFGPSAAAARLEASKSFARDVCRAAGVPMARGRAFTDTRSAIEYAAELDLPVVVKADGLAAGKGVTICATLGEAERAIRESLETGRFGEAGLTVVVEQFLAGREASVFALCDGTAYALLPAARDHKRAFDQDAGPNTGGMGAYSPVAEIDDAALASIGEAVIAPVLREMAQRGAPFRGVLFAGLMLTVEGPRVLEFNIRFGDPETQAILPRVDAPLAQLMLECATDRLSVTGVLPVKPFATVALVLAAEGYPEATRHGDVIGGIGAAREMGAFVLGAGVARSDEGAVVTAGGRVLSVVGTGEDVASAADLAYAAAQQIEYPGKWSRRDIGRSLEAMAVAS
ncbi:MAG TPA: phosphoribosylamine--glycine ligase [Candidatus Limnocylindria bacterium]|nr:phosphoribosylamine--glycine ligase [Candidatus Limnocylindria bacterium]